jgi:hypothetical protein
MQGTNKLFGVIVSSVVNNLRQAGKSVFAASFFAAALSLASLALPSVATAGEGSFGWIYTLDLQPKGKLEFEQRLSLVRKQANGTYDFWRSRTEIEYGLTNDLQIAAYLNAHS